MVAEDPDDRHADRLLELARQPLRLLRQPMIRQVAAQQHDVAVASRLDQRLAQRRLRRAAEVQIGQGGDAHDSISPHFSPRSVLLRPVRRRPAGGCQLGAAGGAADGMRLRRHVSRRGPTR